MGSNFLPTHSAMPTIYTHNPYRNVLDYPALYTEQMPCECESCLRQQQQAPYHPAYYAESPNDSVYAYSDSHSEPPYEIAQLPSVPTQECSVIDPIDRPTKYVFVGQLPFQLSDDKVNWLVREFGGASRVFGVEAIWKPNKVTGEMQHKGCAHVLVPRDEVLAIVNNLHHHILMHHDLLLYGEADQVEHWAGRAFSNNMRVASNALVCEGSARQVRPK